MLFAIGRRDAKYEMLKYLDADRHEIKEGSLYECRGLKDAEKLAGAEFSLGYSGVRVNRVPVRQYIKSTYGIDTGAHAFGSACKAARAGDTESEFISILEKYHEKYDLGMDVETRRARKTKKSKYSDSDFYYKNITCPLVGRVYGIRQYRNSMNVVDEVTANVTLISREITEGIEKAVSEHRHEILNEVVTKVKMDKRIGYLADKMDIENHARILIIRPTVELLVTVNV